jgi:hypothetical protein
MQDEQSKTTQTNTKGAVRNMPDDVPEIEAQEFDWAIHTGGALTLSQCEQSEPFDLDVTIQPATL